MNVEVSKSADKRNIEHLNKTIEQARNGKVKRLSKKVIQLKEALCQTIFEMVFYV